MITWSDGKTSTGVSYLDQNIKPVEKYAFECEEFSKGLWVVRVYVGRYFHVMSDYFRTEDETKEYMQFVRDLMALRFPDAYETALSQFKGEQNETN
jgi:hypothetical protein